MKHFSYLVMFMAFWVAACQSGSPSLTELEKNEIKTEVGVIFDRMVVGMNEHDAEKIASCYLRSGQFHLAGDGNICSDWENWMESLTEWHRNPAHQDWSVAIDEVIIDVLNREMAIVIARGTTLQPQESGETIRRGYTVTDFFNRQECGWIIINEHESVSDPIREGG